MSESKHDYEEDIRRLMSTLSVEASAVAPSDSATERREKVRRARLSSAPAATTLSDLPLVLGGVSYGASETSPVDQAGENLELIIPTEDMMNRSHGGVLLEGDCAAIDEDAFYQHYLHTQTVDDEASRTSKGEVGFFENNIIRQGDPLAQVLRKGLFWTSLLVFAGALCFGAYALGIQPLLATRQDQQLAGAYDPDQDGTVEGQEGRYPQGMLASFRGLYDINPQVFGYIQFYDTADSFLRINSPIVCSGDNTTYLNKGFDGKLSVDGALFADERCADGKSSLTVIYGKNASNGRMFAGLNTLVGSVNNARAASRFTYSTLYEKAEYRVFAVVLTDEAATGERYFDCCRTDFSSDAEFAEYMKAVKARSLFDYGVSATATDDVVVLVTDASHSVAKIANARIAVYARRVRQGEGNPLIVKNDDVIMPLAWYRAQGHTPHSYYSAASTTTPSRGTTTTTTGGTTTTVPSDSEATATTPSVGGETSQTTTTTAADSVGDDGVIEMG